jgi:membrane fusion protein, copper/silver efflux system
MKAASLPSTVWPRATLVVSSLLIALSAALVVQHFRHGWPFSLHHGLPPLDPEPAASATESAAREVRGEAASDERAPIEIDPGRLDALGIRFEPARMEQLGAEVRAVVTIAPDEARITHVHTRVSGWIERLRVRTTGEEVRAGQPLATIFSRELLASQTEYLSVLRAARGGASPLLTGARQRLTVLGMTNAEIESLTRRGEPLRTVLVSAPSRGTVLNRGVSAGTAVDPSTELFTIADLSSVWALAEIPEANIPDIRVGSRARIEVPAATLGDLESVVTFVYPTLSERTRTLRVRFQLPNVERTLLPGMFGSATFTVDPQHVLTVPRDAVVDTGRHQHVFVRAGSGAIEPRAVELGPRVGDRVAILSGLSDGEPVASSGVFILDSESRLRSSGGGGTTHQHGGTSATPSPRVPDEPVPDEHAGHGAHVGHGP